MNCREFYNDKDVKEMVQHGSTFFATSSIKILEIFEPSKGYFLYQIMSPTISLNFFLVNEPSNFWWSFIQNSWKVLDKVFLNVEGQKS